MRLSLAFDACALLAVLVLCGAVATAEQSPDPEGDRVRELHKELAAPRVQAAIASAVPSATADKPLDLGSHTSDKPIVDPQKPITFRVKPESWTTATGGNVLMMAKPCSGGTTNEVSFVVYDGSGKPIVSINECTGKVTVSHPEKMDEQARAFWRTLQRTWPQVCAPPAKAAP